MIIVIGRQAEAMIMVRENTGDSSAASENLMHQNVFTGQVNHFVDSDQVRIFTPPHQDEQDSMPLVPPFEPPAGPQQRL